MSNMVWGGGGWEEGADRDTLGRCTSAFEASFQDGLAENPCPNPSA